MIFLYLSGDFYLSIIALFLTVNIWEEQLCTEITFLLSHVVNVCHNFIVSYVKDVQHSLALNFLNKVLPTVCSLKHLANSPLINCSVDRSESIHDLVFVKCFIPLFTIISLISMVIVTLSLIYSLSRCGGGEWAGQKYRNVILCHCCPYGGKQLDCHSHDMACKS